LPFFGAESGMNLEMSRVTTAIHQLLPVAALALLTACHEIPASADNEQAVAGRKPNILIVLLDDLGKEWLPVYGGEDVGVPNIDALAAGGLVLDNAYVMPQCTPTRVSLLTGQYPFRHGWVNHWDVPRWGHGYFDWRRYPSIARALRASGYATVAAGKWQINDFRLAPDALGKLGFDDYLMWTGYESGVPASAERYWNPYLHGKDGSRTYAGRFGEDLFVEHILEFIALNADTPWFAYYAMALPHVPLTTTPAEPEAADDQQFAAMVRYTDAKLGQLVSELERMGELDDTIIFWLADNGSDPSLSATRYGRVITGGKSKTLESGINVPFIVSSPWLTDGGGRSEALVDVTDLYPTLLELAQSDYTEDHVIDGVSFAPLVMGAANDSDRDWIMAMGGGNFAAVSQAGVENQYRYRDRVVRDKRYKLYVGASPRYELVKLVDLFNDPDEATNLLGSDDPDARAALAKFEEVLRSMPDTDNDPMYERRSANDWDVEVTVESQAWKN
jgi:arylsulfatase A-like enzyme